MKYLVSDFVCTRSCACVYDYYMEEELFAYCVSWTGYVQFRAEFELVLFFMFLYLTTLAMTNEDGYWVRSSYIFIFQLGENSKHSGD